MGAQPSALKSRIRLHTADSCANWAPSLKGRSMHKTWSVADCVKRVFHCEFVTGWSVLRQLPLGIVKARSVIASRSASCTILLHQFTCVSISHVPWDAEGLLEVPLASSRSTWPGISASVDRAQVRRVICPRVHPLSPRSGPGYKAGARFQ